jgi:RNA polymerase sigma-70 factor (ECF subfamily)
MLKGRARDAFREAFERGVMSLTARDRNLLRLHLLGGVTLEKLAAMYDVHRATIVRWLAAARAAVLEETRRGLGAELGLGASELESLMVAVQSRLDVSVERMLASVP